MSGNVLNKIIIYSLIAGAIFGIIASIPIVGILGLILILLFCAPIVILYMIMNGSADLENVKDSIIYGAISGFSANISFCTIYAIFVIILANLFNYTTNYILMSVIMNSGIFLMALLIIFISVLPAVTNSFSLFVTYYILNYIRDTYEKRHENFKD